MCLQASSVTAIAQVVTTAVKQLSITSLSLKYSGLALPSPDRKGCCPPELAYGSLPGSMHPEPTAEFLDTAKALGFLACVREMQGALEREIL